MRRPHEIDKFEKYIQRKDVKKVDKDPAQAKNLFRRAESKFQNFEKLGLTEETATDYLENLYQSITMMIQGLMSNQGFKPYKHEAIIAFTIDILDIGMIEANRLNRYRKLRNDIAYRGDTVGINEAENIRELYKNLRKSLEKQKEF